MKRHKVTVVIITYNEESNITTCLEHAKWADEIVVVDSFSTDRTVQICKSYTDKVFQHKWLGYAKQKNYALQFVDTEWVLFVDADEIVPEELAQEIRTVLNSDQGFAGYDIPRINYFLGKPLRFSDQYNRITRLFKRDAGKWEEREVHERPIVNGKIGSLRTPIEHLNPENNSISLYLDRLNMYTDLEVTERIKEGKTCKPSFDWKAANFRVKLKYFACFLPFKPLLRFIWIYIIKLGFLDGYRGFLWAMLHGFILEMIVSAKLFEYKHRRHIFNNRVRGNHKK